MSARAGNLLWNRRRITLPVGTTDIDTLLTQVNRAFDTDPPFGASGVAAPPSGTLPASRIMVIPMAPTIAWADITHSEPYLNTTTDTIHVTFENGGGDPIEINVLFWDPHSGIGPGQADTYNQGVG